ncbi:arsenate reductase [Methylocella sp.]|uniref:arsenate reductase n=1 Tax=Methylocella sp. TaxID=1978226 RepID=UPI0035B324BC
MTEPATIYGIRNCDTMKKARAWLEARGIACAFHDYKTQGLTRDKLEEWSRKVGWEKLLNRSGTTFRSLPEPAREGIDEVRAIALMLEKPTMIRRPALEIGDRLVVGFRPEIYEAAFR